MDNYKQICPECYFEVLLNELEKKVSTCPNCGGKKIAWQKIERIGIVEYLEKAVQDEEEEEIIFEEYEKEYDIIMTESEKTMKQMLCLKFMKGIFRSNFEILIEESDTPCILGRSGRGNEYFESDKRISNEHFSIIIEDEKWKLIDEESTNGTYINGQRVQPHKKTLLKDGDIIKLGRTDTSMILEVHVNVVG